jgi:glycosyltransferase involved in cell wall biosynthesis
MKVAIVAPESHPRLWGAFAGGITQYVAGMAEGYTRLGHEVHVFARSPEAGTAALGDATVHYTRPAAAAGALRLANPLVDELRTWSALRRAARRTPFDVIEVIDWDAPALLSVHLSRRSRVMVKLHGPRDFIAVLNQRPVRRLERFAAWRERHLARRADLLCSADSTLAEEMARIWGLSGPPPTIPDPVLPPRLPAAPADRGDGAFRIIAVGRLERRKDQLTLVRALAELGPEGAWSATFVGPDTPTAPGGGSYRAAMLAEMPAWLGERVEFVDFASREELWALYAQSDVAVVCTVDGNYGYSTLDPLTAGLAVITTTPEGAPESPYVRHGETALVYPSGRHAELARHLERLAGDRALGRALGARGREHVLAALSAETIAASVLGRLALAA